MATVRNAAQSQKRRQDRRTPNGGAEAVAAADLAVGQCATSLRRLRRGAAGAAAYYGDRRRAEGYRTRWQRADGLRIGAPVQRLIAELHVEIARGAEKINARGTEGRRDVGLREIKQAGARVGGIGDGNIEPTVGGLHRDGSDRRRRWRWKARVHACALAGGVHRGDDARQRDRKSTRLNSSHSQISYAVFCLKKK